MKKLVFIAIFSILINDCIAQKITIRRSFESEECTMGYLYVNDQFIGYTLEREGKKILSGNYGAFIRTDGSKGWRIELADVYSRTNIQIHIGNYPWQSTGCTLLGSEANPKNCTISGSADAMAKLEEALINIDEGLRLNENSSQKYSINVSYE